MKTRATDQNFSHKERVLSLDISTKTGWTFILIGDKEVNLQAYGTIPQVHKPDIKYPDSFVDWSHLIFGGIMEIIDQYAPDTLVIEETSKGSKNAHSQKILEWTHYLLAKFIKESTIKNVYLMTEEWRRMVGCKMTKEESEHNKAVKKYKTKNKSRLAYNEAGKRIGKLTRKHVNVRRANEIFGLELKMKDNDTADAMLLAYAYYMRKNDRAIL